MSKITPFLWFDDQALEAARFYVSLFGNSRLLGDIHYDGVPDGPAANVSIVRFELDGREFMALNGGPHFKFNEAFSMFVECDGQAEVDRLWDALTSDGGEESQCGWLKDKYGLSWQIVPTALGELLGDPDREKGARVMQAMLKMRKIIVADLQAAYEG